MTSESKPPDIAVDAAAQVTVGPKRESIFVANVAGQVLDAGEDGTGATTLDIATVGPGNNPVSGSPSR